MIERENFDYLETKLGTLGKKLLAKKARTSTKIVISSWLLLIVFITSALTLFSDQSFKFMPLYSKEDLVHPHEFLFSIASREPRNLSLLQRKAQTQPGRPAKPFPGSKKPAQIINIRKLQSHQPTVLHALAMINATIKGGVSRVRLNDYPVNKLFSLKEPLEMFPESEDSFLARKIARYALELLSPQDL